MQLTKISVNNLLFLLLYICLVIFSINYGVFLSFRPLDIIFIGLFLIFLIYNPKINKLLLLLVLASISILFISNFIGILKNDDILIEKIIFFYKYLFIFSIPWIVVSIVKTFEQIKIINKVLLINFLFLSSWTYIYLYLLDKGIIRGSFRPSFPLSNDYLYSDAHLYSAYLGFSIVSYVFYLRPFFRHNIFISTLIIINGILGLILTGSRTGILLLGISLFLYFVFIIINTLSKKKQSFSKRKFILYVISFFLIPISFFLFLFLSTDIFFNDYERLIQRAFNFELANDESSLGRVKKFEVAINDANYSGLLLGLGFSNSLIWYDGLFAILLSHGGLLFILVIVFFYFLIIRKALKHSTNQNKFLTFLLLILLYLIANVISEYIFVSRNAFPILVTLSIVYKSIILNGKFKIN